MNHNKATNEEGFEEKFFKHGFRGLVSHLLDLFNHAIRTSFPSSWSHHIIHRIYKWGHSSNPNNYRMTMVDHTFSKLYAMVIHRNISSDLENRHLKAKGHVGFEPTHETIDHIFTLQAIIGASQNRSSKVYYCFVYFWKDFYFVPREALFQRLKDIGISHTLLTSIMHLYESVLGFLHRVHGISDQEYYRS